MPEKLILFPFGGNAREALNVIQSSPSLKEKWDVIGFVDDDASLAGKESGGVSVIGGKEQLEQYPEAKVLAVPGSPMNYLERVNIISGLGILPDRYATIIDDSAQVAADAIIQPNTLIMANAVVSCGVTVGRHCVILPNTVISHDSSIGDYACLGANVTVCGDVRIGSNCFIGAGSNIREKVVIESKCLVGMGSNVISNVEEGATVFGNPAKARTKVAG